MERYKQQVEVLEEMIALLKLRIKEMQGNAPAYEEMLESLEWELKTVNQRIEDEKQ